MSINGRSFTPTAPPADDKDSIQKHPGDVEKFISLLVEASTKARASVVLTVRADFYSQFIRNPLLSALLPQRQVNIPPMRSDDLRSAIVSPAERAGLSFAPPELVDQILNDVGTQEGRLPLLQFALKETWERRAGNKLSAEAYMEVGGVTGAIEKTAESAYERLTTAQKEAARHLFLRLVAPGEGQEDTRARSFMPDDPQQLDVIRLFSDPKIRLLVTGLAPLQATGQAASDVRATVEVAHEALIQRWHTLRGWVDQNRESLRARVAILRSREEWEEKGEIDAYLLPAGVQLERGRALLANPGDVPVDDLRIYVERSIKSEDDRLSAEREEALADQKQIADAERQARAAAEQKVSVEQRARSDAEAAARKLRTMLTVSVVTALFAVVSAVGLYHEYRRAEQQANEAHRQTLEARRQAERADIESNRASEQAKEANRQLDRANQALAQSIIDNLTSTTFTPAQRNGLWALAVADKSVKKYVLSTLINSPEDMLNAGDALGRLFRALGVLRPSSAEAEMLFAAAMKASQTAYGVDNPDNADATLDAVATKLSEHQRFSALESLLRQVGKSSDPSLLQALPRSIHVLSLKLSKARAQELLELTAHANHARIRSRAARGAGSSIATEVV